eukprot:COSAG05_NODE_302_length_11841_cov_253.738801_7_plen_70_part_00
MTVGDLTRECMNTRAYPVCKYQPYVLSNGDAVSVTSSSCTAYGKVCSLGGVGVGVAPPPPISAKVAESY